MPPYHCILNAIELVWSQLKHRVRHQNAFFSEDPEKVVDLIKQVCDSILTPENWSNFVKHAEKEENVFRERDHIVDRDIDPLIISVDEESDDDLLEENNSDIEIVID